MRKNYFYFLITLLFSGCTGCNDAEQCVELYNNSNRTIYNSRGWNYPDTTIFNNYVFASDNGREVLPFQNRRLCEPSHSSFEGLFQHHNDMVMFFILDDSVRRNSGTFRSDDDSVSTAQTAIR